MPEIYDLPPQMLLNILSAINPIVGAANVGARAGTAIGNNYLDAKKEMKQGKRQGLPDMEKYTALAKQKPGDQFGDVNFVTGISPPTAVAAQPAKPAAQVMGQQQKPADGQAALSALQGSAPGSIPAEKVGAPVKPDLNALIDQSMVDTMQAKPQDTKPLSTPEDATKLEELLRPKSPNYKYGSEGDMKGVSGLKRFIGYSKTGNWRSADQDEMIYQLQKAKFDRGDQDYTPQEKAQLELLLSRKADDEKAARNATVLQNERLSQSQNQLREQRLRNQGQIEEARVRLQNQLGGDSKLANALLERYPDLFAGQIEDASGLRPDPNVLKVITQGRLPAEKDADPMKEILAQYLEQTLSAKNPGFKPGAKAPTAPAGQKPLELRALGGK